MPTSRRIGLYSEATDGSGTDRIPLASLGRVSAVVYGTTWPGGDDALSFNIELDPLAQPGALMIGRRIRARLAGVTLWTGRIDQPIPGQPWQVACTGAASMASQYTAVTSNSTDANVDFKISEGLPWVRTTSLPAGPAPAVLAAPQMSDYLNAAALTANQQWSVDRDGGISFGTPPTSPSYLLLGSDRPARTAENYITQLYGLYIDSSTGAVSYVFVNSGTTHGTREDTVDLTGFGPITAAAATSRLQTLVARSGYRARYSAPFTVQPGRLLLYGGGSPKDLATIRAGSMVRPTGLNPDQLGETTVGIAAADFVIGATSYDDDTGVLSLTPFEDATHSADLQSLVADLIKQAA